MTLSEKIRALVNNAHSQGIRYGMDLPCEYDWKAELEAVCCESHRLENEARVQKVSTSTERGQNNARIEHIEYLIRKKGEKQIAHLWTGRDSFCRMAATGGLPMRKYRVVQELPSGFHICQLCLNHPRRR